MIIKSSIERVNQWPHAGLGAAHVALCDECQGRLVGQCDTPFRSYTKHEKWKYKGRIFDNDDINYILEGHALHYLGFSRTSTRLAAWWWKRKQHSRVTADVRYWLLKGWDEYDVRSGW